MPEQLTNAEFNTMMREVIASEGAARATAVRATLLAFVQSDIPHKWSLSIARQSNYWSETGIADIESVIIEAVARTIGAAVPENTERVSDWLSFLHGQSKRKVSDYLGSAAVTGVSGMRGVTRRKAIIAKTRKELVATLNREPTNQEIIENANAWAWREHSDPVKQGILITEADFSDALMSQASIEDPVARSVATTVDMDTIVEAQLAMQRLRRQSAAMFPGDKNLMLVVNEWEVLVASGERPTRPRIQEATGMTADEVKRAMAQMGRVLSSLRAEAGVDA